MLGIPVNGTPDAVIFWSSFWPALYSGFLSSIFTGLIVGLIVIWYQRTIENRHAIRSYEREVSVMRQRLCEAVACPDSFVIASAKRSVPPKVGAAMKVIQDLPISLWREELPKKKNFLNAIHKLQLSYSTFNVVALNLDHLLHQFIRTYNAAHNVDSINDGTFVAYVLGSLQGFSSAELLIQLDRDHRALKLFDPASDSAKADPKIIAAHTEYVNQRKLLVDAVEILANELNKST